MTKGCFRCGKPGSHFVPPCLGDPGFYICAPKEEVAKVFCEYYKERLTFYALDEVHRQVYQRFVDEYEANHPE